MPATPARRLDRDPRGRKRSRDDDRARARSRRRRPRHGGRRDGAGRGAPPGRPCSPRRPTRRPAPREAFGARLQRQHLCGRARALPRIRRSTWSTSRRRTSSTPSTPVLAAEHGKHVILEKPMALTLADCDRIIAAVERASVHLVVGHTHAFDPAVRAMRGLIASGELGAPRHDRVVELHQLPLSSAPARGARHRAGRRHPVQPGAASDRHRAPARRRPGQKRARAGRRARSGAAHRRQLRPRSWSSQSGVAASLVYGGYDFFDSDELHFWISERGTPKQPAHGAARRALAGAQATTRPSCAPRASPTGRADGGEPPHQPHFGLTVATCARGELRASADGVLVYGENGRREVAHAGGGNVFRAATTCSTTARPRSCTGQQARARRPLGQGDARGRARDPAVRARAAGDHAAASGRGAGRELTARRSAHAPTPACGEGGRVLQFVTIGQGNFDVHRTLIHGFMQKRVMHQPD